MAAESPTIHDFISSVFEVLRDGCYYNTEREVSAFNPPYADFNRLLHLLHFGLDRMHQEDCKEYFFQCVPVTRSNVFTLLTLHCETMCCRNGSIFIALLYCCSFTYTVFKFWERQNMPGFLELAVPCMESIFLFIIQPRFDIEGGWNALFMYCDIKNPMNILHVLDFINVCYSEKFYMMDKFYRNHREIEFGVHSDETLKILKKNLHVLEDFAIAAFNREITTDPDYKELIHKAFLKIDLALKHSAPYPIPRIAARDVLVSPIWEQYLANYDVGPVNGRLAFY